MIAACRAEPQCATRAAISVAIALRMRATAPASGLPCAMPASMSIAGLTPNAVPAGSLPCPPVSGVSPADREPLAPPARLSPSTTSLTMTQDQPSAGKRAQALRTVVPQLNGKRGQGPRPTKCEENDRDNGDCPLPDLGTER